MLMLHREAHNIQDATAAAPVTVGTESTRGKSEQAMLTTLASVPELGPIETYSGNRENMEADPAYPDARSNCVASGPETLSTTGGKGKKRYVDPALQV